MASRRPTRKRGRPHRQQLAFVEREPASQAPLRRGELIVERPAVPTTLQRIGVSISSLGQIEWPRYKTLGHELGELVQEGTITLSGFSKLERQRKHITRSVAREYLFLENMTRDVQELYNHFLSHPIPQVEKEKAILVTRLTRMAESLGTRLRKESKRNAQGKLHNAAELARAGNKTAFVNQLWGVFNDLGIRLSSLNLQRPRILRGVKLAIAKNNEQRLKGIARIEETDRLIYDSARGRVSERDRNITANHFSSRAIHYRAAEGPKPTPEGKKMAELYDKAAKQFRQGEVEVVDTLRELRQQIYVRYARNFIVKANMFREIGRWPAGTRHQIITHQLKLAEDNVEYWRASPRRFFWFSPWLTSISNSMALDSKLRGMQKTIALAAADARQGNYSGAQEKIQFALGMTS